MMWKKNKISCQAPIELEDEGSGLYRVFYRECEYDVKYYQVRDEYDRILALHDTLKEANQDCQERHYGLKWKDQGL